MTVDLDVFRLGTELDSPSWKRVPCEEEAVRFSRAFDRGENGSQSSAINRPTRKSDIGKSFFSFNVYICQFCFIYLKSILKPSLS